MDEIKRQNKIYIKQVGLALYIYRQLSGYSIKQICDEANLKIPTFCSYENGNREIDLYTLMFLSRRYGVSTDKMLCYHPLDDLWTRYKQCKNAKIKKRLGDTIMLVSSFMNSNGGVEKYTEYRMNEMLSMVGDVVKDRAKGIKK